VEKHHKFGPSKLENYDPRRGGCASFIPLESTSEAAFEGKLKHAALAGDDSVLEGDEAALAQVQKVRDFLGCRQLPGTEQYRELTLSDDLFFGTLDFLSIHKTQGLIIDAKFGNWSVTPARTNLQGWGYASLVFYNFPQLGSIRVIFYLARDGTFSEASFFRSVFSRMKNRLRKIVRQASRIATQGPAGLADFTPEAVNCSFCARLNCPARLALCSSLVTQWTGVPVQLPHLDLLAVSLEELGLLKRLSIVLKNFANAIDAEARRRAFDCDQLVPGYEVREKSGPRRILGAAAIAQAAQIADSLMPDGDGETWKKFVLEAVELSVSDLEKAIVKGAVRGTGAGLRNRIIGELEKAGLIAANPVFYLAAIRK